MAAPARGGRRCAPQWAWGGARHGAWSANCGKNGGGVGWGAWVPPPPSQVKTTARRLVKWLALSNAVSPFLILLLSIGANGVDTSHRTKALHMADAYTHSHTHADTHTPIPRCTHTRTHTRRHRRRHRRFNTRPFSSHTFPLRTRGPGTMLASASLHPPPSSAHPTPFLSLL